ncbi:MAG: DMT family transporter [Micrococcales bacterium]
MSKKQTWPADFAALTLIWGASFLFIAVAGSLLPPVGVAFWRMLLGALALFVMLKIQGHKLPTNPKAWLHTAVAGLFMSAIPFTLFAFGELHIASGLAGMINAATPVMTVLVILIAFRDQTPTRTQVIGLSIGIVGTLVLLGVWNGFGTNDPLSVIALLVATVCYGFGSPYIRKFVGPLGLPNTVAVFMQLITASIMISPFYLFGPITTGSANWANLGSIVTLGVVGTGLAYVFYYRIIEQAGSTIASSVTITQPVVAVILGMLLLAEHINWYEVLGGLVIIFGALVAQNRIKFIR